MLIAKGNVFSSKQIINIMLNRIRKKFVSKSSKNYNIKRFKLCNIKKINYFSIILMNIISNINIVFPDYSNFNFLEINMIDILINKNYYYKAKSFLNLLKMKISYFSKDFIQLIKSSDSLYRCKIILKTYYCILLKKIKQQKNLFDYLKKIYRILSKIPKINTSKNGLIILNSSWTKTPISYLEKSNNTKKKFSYCFKTIKIKDCFFVKQKIKIIIVNKFFNLFKKHDTLTKILIFILIVYLKFKIMFHYEIHKNNYDYCLIFFKNITNIVRTILPEFINISLYFPHKIKHSFLKKKIFIFYIFLLKFFKKFLLKYNCKIKFLFMNLYDAKNQIHNFL
uniref:RNA helicase n=1 Tax=Lotharella vacuolata TaxID=74820 RepID=A0A0H5BK50_9EUKA|nr:RNA helicase [Lotharella vacuolata]